MTARLRLRAAVVAGVSGCLLAAGSIATTSASALASNVDVHISPANPVVGDHLTVSGTATDAGNGQQLTISRSDTGGSYSDVTTTTTDTNGAFTYTDTRPAVQGMVTYTVSWVNPDTAGSGMGSAQANVRLAPSLTLKADRTTVTWDHVVHLTAHLGGPATGTVTIWKRPYGGTRSKVASGSVDANGNFAAAPTVTHKTTYSVTFDGDATYAPGTASVLVKPRGVVVEHLSGGYANDGAYRVYHPSGVPVLHARIRPTLDGVCLWFRAERRYNGAWHRVAVGCIHTDAYGRAVGRFTGDHHLRSPYRVRARWAGNKLVAAGTGAWFRLEFR